MKRLLLLMLTIIGLSASAQIQPTKPYRSAGPAMVKDSALAVGQFLIPTYTTPSLGNYADRWGQSFGLDRTTNQLKVRGNGQWLSFPTLTEVQSMISTSISGSGTINTLPMFLSPTSVGNSLISQDGYSVGVNGVIVNDNVGDPPHVFNITNDSGGAGQDQYLFQATAYAGNTGLANFHVRKARGTAAIPLAVLSGDVLASFGFRGYASTKFASSSAAIQAIAEQNFTDTQNGTSLIFQTTSLGTVDGRNNSLKLEANGDGRFFKDLLISGSITSPLSVKAASPFIQWKNTSDARLGYIQHNGVALTIASDVGNVSISNTVNVIGKITASVAPTTATDVVRKTELDLKANSSNPSFTGSVGIGTTSPEASLHLSDANAIYVDRYQNGNPLLKPNMFLRAFGGTKVSPVAITDGASIGAYVMAANYDNTSTTAQPPNVQILGFAKGAQTSTAHGGQMRLVVTRPASINPETIIDLQADTLKLIPENTDAIVTVGLPAPNVGVVENSHKMQVVGRSGHPTVSFGNYGTNAGFHGWSSRGTYNSPSKILNGDSLFSFGFRGWGDTGLQGSSGSMTVYATEDFSDTAQGTRVIIQTNANGHNATALGRTSTFEFGQDGAFSAPYMRVKSFTSQFGSYRFDAGANAASRSWRIANDYNAFGDFAIMQSTTQLGETYNKKLYITPTGSLQFAGDVETSQYKLSDLNTAPASATATGVKGEIRVTADYIYVCVATNTWKRTPLTTW